MLQAVSVALMYGDQVIFDDVSLTLGAGERVGLIGENGSGKTSLLRVLAGQLRCQMSHRRHVSCIHGTTAVPVPPLLAVHAACLHSHGLAHHPPMQPWLHQSATTTLPIAVPASMWSTASGMLSNP